MYAAFKNLGPLREAEVDLSKPLIILSGPNNTGKTYLAWCLYGLLFGRRPQLMVGGPFHAAQNLARRLLDSPQHSIDGSAFADAAADVLRDLARDFKERLPRFFATNESLFKACEIALRFDDRDMSYWRAGGGLNVSLDPSGNFQGAGLDREKDTSQFQLSLTYGPDSTKAIPKSAEEAPSSEPEPSVEKRLSATQRWLVDLITIFTPSYLPEFRGGVSLFPAERIAISVFAKELALNRTAVVDRVLDAAENNVDAKAIVERKAGRYPEPIRECIAIANDLTNLSRNKGPFADLADSLEELLGGKVDVSDSGELGFTPNSSSSPRLALHLSSSIVKSLASFVFFLRYTARPGVVAIIDEPELNLHPNLQRRVARFLARLVRQDIRLIISTHSDYCIRELSNIVRLGEMGPKGKDLASRLGHDPNYLLRADEVGVWLVDKGHAERLPVNNDGFTVPTIDNAIEEQNTETQAIEFGPE